MKKTKIMVRGCDTGYVRSSGRWVHKARCSHMKNKLSAENVHVWLTHLLFR